MSSMFAQSILPPSLPPSLSKNLQSSLHLRQSNTRPPPLSFPSPSLARIAPRTLLPPDLPLPEAEARMKRRHRNLRHNDHHRIEDDEFSLILHDLVPPASRHLSYPIRAPDEDDEPRREDRTDK